MPLIENFLFEDDYDADDWKEDIFESRRDTVGHDASLCTLSIICEFAKVKAAERFILGYAYVDETNKLRRINPVWHPTRPWLYARKILDTAYSKATGKADGPFENGVQFAVYTWAKLTIEFADVTYPVLEDDDITFEYERYTVLTRQPYGELINLDPGVLKYHCPGVAGGPNGKPAAVSRLFDQLQKARLLLKWYRVPLDFVQDGNGNQPKLSAITKRVNSATFLGRNAGTLLCEDVVLSDPYPAPTATDTLGEPLFMTDITFNLVEFNPDRGDTTIDKYGWNLLPGPRVAGTGGDKGVGFYFATHDGTLTGKPMFQEYAFADAFTYHGA